MVGCYGGEDLFVAKKPFRLGAGEGWYNLDFSRTEYFDGFRGVWGVKEGFDPKVSLK